MQCGLLLGLYKNYCLGLYWWKLSHFADVVTVKFRRYCHFQLVCNYLFASAVMWETGVLFLCVCVCVCVYIYIYICTSCNDWSWSRWQRSCKYLISTVATWVQYAPHEVICSYVWTLAHSSSNTSDPKNKKILIQLYNIVLCSVLCTRCVVYSVYCILCQLFPVNCKNMSVLLYTIATLSTPEIWMKSDTANHKINLNANMITSYTRKGLTVCSISVTGWWLTGAETCSYRVSVHNMSSNTT